jgi:hypothetical protein
MNSPQAVVVLGASEKPDRYSNKAVRTLLDHGHRVIPVHPRLDEVEGLAVAPDLGSVAGPVDTLTVYLSPERSLPLADAMIALKPGRVILNPGTESDELESKLGDAGIPVVKACTIVMNQTGAF